MWASSRKWACLWERHAPIPLVTHGSSWGACKFVARLRYKCRLGTNGLSEVPSELCCLSSSVYASCLLPSTLHTSTSHLLPSTFYNRLSKVYLDAATSCLLPSTLCFLRSTLMLPPPTFYLSPCTWAFALGRLPSTLGLLPPTFYLLPSAFYLCTLLPFTSYCGLVRDTSSTDSMAWSKTQAHMANACRKLFLHAKMHVHSPKGMDLLAKKAQMVPDNYPSSRKAQATQNQMHSTKLPCTPDSCITFFAMRPKLLVNLPWPA